MALERFKQALATLLDGAPSDPLERDEYFELHTLPTDGGQVDDPIEMGIIGAVQHTVTLQIPQPLLLVSRDRVVGKGRHHCGCLECSS